MKYQKGYTIVEVFTVVLLIGGIGGWIANIVKIASSDFAQITGMLVLRIVGIFIAPLGSVLGFL